MIPFHHQSRKSLSRSARECLPRVSGRDVVKALLKAGYEQDRQARIYPLPFAQHEDLSDAAGLVDSLAAGLQLVRII
jgi:hypothetical protein